MRVTAALLATVAEGQFKKAVEGMRSGAYQILITAHDDTAVRGSVRRGDGNEYRCTITSAGASCSCRDARYRQRICKHAVLLALYAISTPRSFSQLEGEGLAHDSALPPPDLTLVKVRPGFTFSP